MKSPIAVFVLVFALVLYMAMTVAVYSFNTPLGLVIALIGAAGFYLLCKYYDFEEEEADAE